MVDFMILKMISNGSYASQSQIHLISVSGRVKHDDRYPFQRVGTNRLNKMKLNEAPILIFQ